MSAHKIPIESDCQSPNCTHRAAFIVRNTFNAEMGRYCTRHADQRVVELQRGERERPR